MQFLEATLSFLVLITFSLFLFIASDEKIDNSLYLYELQGDVKNVIHLNNGFANRTIGNIVVNKILDETNLCFEMEQTDITSRCVFGEKFSSSVMVPKLKDLKIKGSNKTYLFTEINLTGFTQDKMFFGLCN